MHLVPSSLNHLLGMSTDEPLLDNSSPNPAERYHHEVQSLLQEYHAKKDAANQAFAHGDFGAALRGYHQALATCDATFEYHTSLLHSNISACHLKLADWAAAIDAATEALEGLDRVRSQERPPTEQICRDLDSAQPQRAKKNDTLPDHAVIEQLRIKVLLRRAKARMEAGNWASLEGAQEDYQHLSQMQGLRLSDQKAVRSALLGLPALMADAKTREMGEMMGTLKQLGNSVLKPFGLSTESFNLVADEAQGGYSVQFRQA